MKNLNSKPCVLGFGKKKNINNNNKTNGMELLGIFHSANLLFDVCNHAMREILPKHKAHILFVIALFQS